MTLPDVYRNFKGKRILFLGAHVLTIHLIHQAKKMGVYTIVTDYVPNAPAKAVADESYDVSTSDVEALIRLAKKCRVDGVFTGYTDNNLIPCRMVCEALNLPFYATLEQIRQTMNKANFKRNCRQYGLSVTQDVPEQYLDGVYDKIRYPVIVKPADSYSSKGISVCYNMNEMPKAIAAAYEKSSCRQIVVEDYIKADDVYLYFTIQDGYLSLSAMADRLMNDSQVGCAPQPMGYSFPSRYLNLYFEKAHEKLCAMIKGLGIQNGSFFLQGFVFDHDIHFFEMGLRLSGGAGYLQIARQNEINQVEMHIRYALSGKFDGWKLKEYDNPYFRHPAYVVVILLKNGTIQSIQVFRDVLNLPAVFDIVQFRHEGDKLEERGTLNQVFARIYMEAPTSMELQKSLQYIRDTLRIVDEHGENMILNFGNAAEKTESKEIYSGEVLSYSSRYSYRIAVVQLPSPNVLARLKVCVT